MGMMEEGMEWNSWHAHRQALCCCAVPTCSLPNSPSPNKVAKPSWRQCTPIPFLLQNIDIADDTHQQVGNG